jgi:hypothetical protein
VNTRAWQLHPASKRGNRRQHSSSSCLMAQFSLLDQQHPAYIQQTDNSSFLTQPPPRCLKSRVETHKQTPVKVHSTPGTPTSHVAYSLSSFDLKEIVYRQQARRRRARTTMSFIYGSATTHSTTSYTGYSVIFPAYEVGLAISDRCGSCRPASLSRL